MSLIIKNLDTVDIALDDLGLTLPASSTLDLITEEAGDVARSATGGDLDTEITGLRIAVLDPLDDVTQLNVADSKEALRRANDAQFRIQAGDLHQLDDVSITQGGSPLTSMPVVDDVLQFNGSVWVNTQLNLDLGDLEDLGDVTYTGSPAPADGDILVYNSTGSPVGWTNVDPGSLFVEDNLAVVQVRRSTNVAVSLAYADIVFDTTDVETQPDVVEHNNTNTDNIDVKEDGLYMVTYQLSIDADAGEETFNLRARINDTTVIPGSERLISEDDEINDAGNVFYVILSAGDFITFQAQASGVGNVLLAESTYTVTRMRGTKGADGAQGPAGSGSTITLEDDGTPVANTPHDTIDFGNLLTVTDNGDGSATVNVGLIFGTEFQRAESATVSTTTSTTFQNKVSLVTPSIPAGTYRVAFLYGWNHDDTTSDFESRCREDSVTLGEIHKQEPKDSAGTFSTTGTSQRFYENRVFYRTYGAAGSHTFDLEYRTDVGGAESSVWDCVIEIWRVS